MKRFPLIFGYAFLYTPILFLIVFSFNKSQYPGTWTGFSLHWYKELFQDTHLLQAVFTSIKIACLSATLAVVLGTMAAIIVVRFKTRTFLRSLLIAPLSMPEVITGFAILLIFLTCQDLFHLPMQRGIFTIMMGHTALALGYTFMIIQMRLQDFDKTLEEAGLDLGATPTQVFLHITLPIISPALFSSWLLAFALSLDDVVIASFLSGPGATTLPILIFSNVRMGITPQINALATIIIGCMVFITILSATWMSRKERIV